MASPQEISTEQAPAAVGPYSQAVRAGNLVFVSGQLPMDPTTGRLLQGDITAQTERVLKNIRAILQSANLDLRNVVRCDVFLKDIKDFGDMNTVYAAHFSGDPKPARQAVQVAALPLDARIEISCIATE
jgi:2-iminobutanoate/2-iminopropanoate deaminase